MIDEEKNCAICIFSAWDISRKENICTNKASDRNNTRVELFETCENWKGIRSVEGN